LIERDVRAQLALPKGITLQRRDDFVFQTTHRDITFRVFLGEFRESGVPQATDIIRRVVSREELASLGMSSPMRRILIEDMHTPTVQTAKRRATSKRLARK
jgi:hypothetical protein